MLDDVPLQRQRDAIRDLARRYRVRRLELFGSAARGTQSVDSDVDLLVEFEPSSPAEHAERYFGLLEDLADLLGRTVDLTEIGAIDNPYFLQAIRDERVLLYAA